MVIAEENWNSDPWHSQADSEPDRMPANATTLRQSPIFPMLLLACLALLFLKATVQLLCLSITSVIFIYRRLSKLSQRSHSNPPPSSEASASSISPVLAMT